MRQKNSNLNYLCCGLDQGSPWEDIFGGGSSQNTARSSEQKILEQVQDWSNPFDAVRNNQRREIKNQQSDESRSIDEGYSRKAADDPHTGRSGYRHQSQGSRSVGSGYGSGRQHHSYQASDEGNHSVGSGYASNRARAEQNPHSRPTALTMHEEMVINGDISHDSSSSRLPMTTTQQIQLSMKTQNEHRRVLTEDNTILAKKAAIARSKTLRHQIMLAKKTETTRRKKDVSPEDVRDPETVPGMKCHVDVETEEAAQTRALTMLVEEEYKFNPKAGLAAFTMREIQLKTRTRNTLLGPIV